MLCIFLFLGYKKVEAFQFFSTWRSYPDAQQINCKTICVCKSFYCFNDTQHQALTSSSIASFCLPIQKYTFYGYFFDALSLSRSISEWIVIFNEIQFSISKWDFSFSPLLDIVIIFVAVLLLCNFRANKSAHIFELNCIEKGKREKRRTPIYIDEKAWHSTFFLLIKIYWVLEWIDAVFPMVHKSET